MGVAKRRRYDSSGRRAEASTRRERVVEAAMRLFAKRGYGATTIGDIAAEAMVSPELIYSSFGNKRELLLRVHEIAVVGDTGEVPLVQGAAARAIQEGISQERQFRLGARLAREVYERSATIWRMIDGAATVDPEIEPLRREREEQRLGDVRTLVEAVARLGPLRYDIAVATDVVYALSSPAVYLMLVEDRKWSPDEYESWLATAFVDQLAPA